MEKTYQIETGRAPDGNVLIYEYGARLDKESAAAVDEQIRKSRALYNNIVALMRDTMAEMRADLLEKAGPEAKATQERIDALSVAFAEAKAKDDEPAMKEIAQKRREAWAELSGQLKEVRATLKAAHRARFFSRIGLNSSCATYQLRSQAVKQGLGWGTANAILKNALIAWDKSITQGRAPQFASAAEKIQDTLTIQFTTSGGITSEDLLNRADGDFVLKPPATSAPRQYGSFQFRLGAASSDNYATGTWQYHRPLPKESAIGVARLIRKKVGKDTKYVLQLQVKLKENVEQKLQNRKPLVTVHFGWSGHVEGRRVAGIADCAEPSSARILALPVTIEESLNKVAELRGERDKARDAIVPLVKKIDPTGLEETVADEVLALKKLPVQHIAISRLHRLCRQLRAVDALPGELEEWRKDDRLRWQHETHLARRARNQRRDFYRNVAIELARQYEVIAIEPLDLAKAAVKLDKTTGEKTDLSKKARSGRVVAAVFELESAIRWAAVKTGAAVLDLTARTASQCSICGNSITDDDEDGQVMHCSGCGAELDRKKNGAAVAWQIVMPERENLAEDYHRARIEAAREAEKKRQERLKKLTESRNKGRGKKKSSEDADKPAEGSEEGDQD